jgi:hypothetical protein
LNSTSRKINFPEFSEDSFSKETFMNFISSMMWEVYTYKFYKNTKFGIWDFMLEKLDLKLIFK